MPLTYDDWREIQKFVNSLLGQQGEYFVQGLVVKNDVKKKLIWLKEFETSRFRASDFTTR